MARQKKFPIPDVSDKEIPYDINGFIRWCIRENGLSEATAKKYVADVKTSFLTVFEENSLFDDIKEAFATQPIEEFPEVWRQVVTKESLLVEKLPDIEDQYDILLDYLQELEQIDEFGDIYIETSEGKEAKLPKDEWVRAFRAYSNYIRWRIDDISSRFGMPRLPRMKDESISIPLSKQFAQYLRMLHGKVNPDWKHPDERRKNSYKGQNGSYSLISRLTKLYNHILISKIPTRILTHLDWLLRKKKCFWSEKDRERLFRIIEMAHKSGEYKDISDVDFKSGKRALELYFDFMKAYSKEQELYQPKEYERVRTNRKD